MVGILVDEGKLSWTTQLQDIDPKFERADPAVNITIADLLSHRTGLPSYDSFWLLSDNRISLDREEAIPIFGYVPVAADLRTEFIYNNMAYEVLGQVIEKVTGSYYFSFLENRILKPLGMSQTFYTNFPTNAKNAATPYIALQNATAFHLPFPVHGDNILMGPAGGVRSSVHHMLILYNAFIDAARSQIEHRDATVPLNPLKQLAHLWRGMVSLPLSTVRESSYASGWVRVQLPALLGYANIPGMNLILGDGLPSRLGLFHGGNIPGFTSFAAIFPETSSAVIVLSNSLPLTDTVNLVGQLLIEELFNNTINITYYAEYAKLSATQSASTMSNIERELRQGKNVKTPVRHLHTYVGRYYNSIGNFFIEIREAAGNLRMYFMGLSSDGFDLEPYQYDSFFWYMSHDDLAQRARLTVYPKEYYIIEFGYINEGASHNAKPGINYLRWKHEFAIEGEGEIFQKSDERSHDLYDQEKSQAPFRG